MPTRNGTARTGEAEEACANDGNSGEILKGKKKAARTFSVRAGRPVTQTTSGFGISITGISTPYYRFTSKQIQKSRFSHNVVNATFLIGSASKRCLY
jgi:hypothetical protein